MMRFVNIVQLAIISVILILFPPSFYMVYLDYHVVKVLHVLPGRADQWLVSDTIRRSVQRLNRHKTVWQAPGQRPEIFLLGLKT